MKSSKKKTASVDERLEATFRRLAVRLGRAPTPAETLAHVSLSGLAEDDLRRLRAEHDAALALIVRNYQREPALGDEMQAELRDLAVAKLARLVGKREAPATFARLERELT